MDSAPPPPPPPPSPAGRRALLALVLLWAVVELVFVRPATIAPHWRQADTQSIALTYHRDGIDLLGPRIWWGGAGPGYVESEFQLYPALVATGMHVAGEHELVAQSLSLALGAAIAVMLYHVLARHGGARGGAIAGLVAAAVWLTSRLGVQLSVAVMPDVLCAAAWLAGFVWFLDWRERGRLPALVLAMLATAVAGLVKPYALHLGVVQFGMLLGAHRARLRSPALWLGWLGVLVVVGAWLWHAHGLFVAHGNSFGVLAGDTKFPSWDRLLDARVYKDLVKVDLAFGVGVSGAVAFAGLALLRRVTAVDVALAAANALLLFVSIRYASDRWLGAHYHVFAALAGAWYCGRLAGIVADVHAPRWPVVVQRLVVIGLVLAGAARLGTFVVEARTEHAAAMQSPVLPLGAALRALRAPGDLVVVRSSELAFDARWQRADNYQDPRLLYVADARGWVVAGDHVGPEPVRAAAADGARWYAEPAATPPRVDPALDAWLATAGTIVHSSAAGRIWRLAPR